MFTLIYNKHKMIIIILPTPTLQGRKNNDGKIENQINTKLKKKRKINMQGKARSNFYVQSVFHNVNKTCDLI